jgi:hypothetical protein
MNDTFTNIHNPIFDKLIKTHIKTYKNTSSPSTHTNKTPTVYIHTMTPSIGSSDRTSIE